MYTFFVYTIVSLAAVKKTDIQYVCPLMIACMSHSDSCSGTYRKSITGISCCRAIMNLKMNVLSF